MKCYAFDVDETLWVSSGPIDAAMIWELREDGHITGMCGNWAAMTLGYPGWHKLFSFFGPHELTKAQMLISLGQLIPADEHVMVGNDPRVKGSSKDAAAAEEAGWRFIREDDFAAGKR